MATLNPDHLFEQAENLIVPPAAGPPRQVDVRRAISAAYYGVFHFVAAAAADEFVGKTKRSSSRYGLAHRGIDHRWLRDLCDDLKKPTPPQKYIPHLPNKGVGPNLAAFATAVVELQEKRHGADYDPMIRVKTSDALAAIKTARAAVARFEQATATRRRAFLALLMFPVAERSKRHHDLYNAGAVTRQPTDKPHTPTRCFSRPFA